MALHTAAALALLAVGLVCARRDGFLVDFVATRPGGQLAPAAAGYHPSAGNRRLAARGRLESRAV